MLQKIFSSAFGMMELFVPQLDFVVTHDTKVKATSIPLCRGVTQELVLSDPTGPTVFCALRPRCAPPFIVRDVKDSVLLFLVCQHSKTLRVLAGVM